MNNLLLETVASTGQFPVYFVAVYVVGFIAAVVIGSIAWYSSKRPVGWEDAEKPDFIPEIKNNNQNNNNS
ncbi:photosystem II assembly protein Psb35 [Geminocystis sp. NIES-3709]|uniref:photosystem II assembly protein Psb35 n=1 Tax=Geminocystis sp. NIES-3709 TaxID=1617448 RepID=UPI0005FC80C5|nr:hypothetical protein [Geminocystis sp. NIES-3709]BAQ65181.1 hypothetical protein GM3709_1946 [Geminocystis sp. NIES-3709]